jgi:hypothetical protein
MKIGMCLVFFLGPRGVERARVICDMQRRPFRSFRAWGAVRHCRVCERPIFNGRKKFGVYLRGRHCFHCGADQRIWKTWRALTAAESALVYAAGPSNSPHDHDNYKKRPRAPERPELMVSVIAAPTPKQQQHEKD